MHCNDLLVEYFFRERACPFARGGTSGAHGRNVAAASAGEERPRDMNSAGSPRGPSTGTLVAFFAPISNTVHSQWVKISRQLRPEAARKLKVSTPTAYVKYRLAMMTDDRGKQRQHAIKEVATLGKTATPVLIMGITAPARPAPIFSNAALANIPIFSMQKPTKPVHLTTAAAFFY